MTRFDEAMTARLNMELFDLAAELLDRVRPHGTAAEKRVLAIRQRLVQERNRQLKPYDRALRRPEEGR